jgi:hypothetical protein
LRQTVLCVVSSICNDAAEIDTRAVVVAVVGVSDKRLWSTIERDSCQSSRRVDVPPFRRDVVM